MLIPTKHINFSQSLIGLSTVLLKIIKKPITVEDLINMYYTSYNDSPKLPWNHSVDNVLLAISFLYMIEKISLSKEGFIIRETN